MEDEKIVFCKCGHNIVLHQHYTNHEMCSARIGVTTKGEIVYCPCPGPKKARRRFLSFFGF